MEWDSIYKQQKDNNHGGGKIRLWNNIKKDFQEWGNYAVTNTHGKTDSQNKDRSDTGGDLCDFE